MKKTIYAKVTAKIDPESDLRDMVEEDLLLFLLEPNIIGKYDKIEVFDIEKYKSSLERKAEERLAQELQKLIDAHDVDKYHTENNHQIELQELKDKAVGAFAGMCKTMGFDCEHCAKDNPSDYCMYINNFINELNK